MQTQNKMNIVPSNDQGEDFEMTSHFAWLRIDGYSLMISNHDNRISVKLFPLHKEAEDELDGFDYFKEE